MAQSGDCAIALFCSRIVTPMSSYDQLCINRRILLGSTSAAVIAAVAGITGAKAAPEDFPGNGDPPLLVDAPWLAARIETDPGLLILDLQKLRDYRDQHIPGAVHTWWKDTMELNNPVYGTLLMEIDDQRQRLDFLRDHGIGPETHVIAYDASGGRWAARLVWFLRFLGHGRSSMLEGGLATWQSLQQPVESGTNEPARRDDVVVEPQPDYYLVTPQLLSRLEEPATVLIDCRSSDERQDTVNNTLPTGQIPGSLWYPWTNALGASDGMLLPATDIQQQFNDLGIDRVQQVIFYARYGVETAHTWLILKLLGYPEVTIYDRGWAGWITHTELPIEPV